MFNSLFPDETYIHFKYLLLLWPHKSRCRIARAMVTHQLVSERLQNPNNLRRKLFRIQQVTPAHTACTFSASLREIPRQTASSVSLPTLSILQSFLSPSLLLLPAKTAQPFLSFCAAQSPLCLSFFLRVKEEIRNPVISVCYLSPLSIHLSVFCMTKAALHLVPTLFLYVHASMIRHVSLFISKPISVYYIWGTCKLFSPSCCPWGRRKERIVSPSSADSTSGRKILENYTCRKN